MLETWLTGLLIVAVYVLCAVRTYQRARAWWAAERLTWRVADRRFFICIALLGPVGLAGVMLVSFWFTSAAYEPADW